MAKTFTEEFLAEEIQTRANENRTICEVIRELWDLSEAVNEVLRPEIQARLLVAYGMGKRLVHKLYEHKFDWPADFWQANEDYEADLRRRSKRVDVEA